MLSLSKLFLPREIHYRCQFGNGVMNKDLWCRSETESPLWMYTQGYAAWRMLVSRYLVMIHYGTTLICYLSWTFPLKRFCVVCWNNQTTYAITVRSKEYITLMYSLVNFLSIQKSPTKIKTYLCVDHVIKIHLPMCGRMSFDSSGDCTHTSSLCILYCKGEALKLFSVGRQLLVLKMENCFLSYRDAGVYSFSLLSNTCVP
jgi:hypothetical protein